MEFLKWLTWVFDQNSPNMRKVFCCALWAIWGERNKRVHEKVSRSGTEIAAFDENVRQSAVGIVARDSQGNALLSITELHHQVASAFAAEAIACRTATRIGMNMQWPNIIIEGDALSIIKKCKTQANDRSRVGAYSRDIHQLLIKSKRHYFEHTPREANRLAHMLAREALKKKEEIYLIGRVPDYAERLKEDERKGISGKCLTEEMKNGFEKTGKDLVLIGHDSGAFIRF
ncbi:hypothetical protein Gotur_028382 [Gossypium turneri]